MPARRKSSRRSTARRLYKKRSYTPKRSYSSKRTSTRKRMTKKSCVCTDVAPGTRWALAQLDPFHPKCLGAKIPDSSTMPSLAISDVEQVSTTTSAVATDLAGIAFRPQYTWGTVSATPGASLNWGATYSTNAANRSKRTTYVSQIELSRPVAHAVRLSCPLSATAATGFVHIGLSTETNYIQTSWTFPTTIAQISGLQYYKRVTLSSLTQTPLTIINKWLDETAFRYSSSASDIGNAGNTGFQTDFGWATIVVILEACPASSVALSYEHLLMSEAIPQKDSFIIGTVAASSAPATVAAVSEASQNIDFGHTESDQQTYIQRGIDAMVDGARTQGEAAFEQFGVPLLNAVGRSAVNSAQAAFMNMVTGTGGIPGVNANPQRLAL